MNRWTNPQARQRFAEFMNGSGLENEYTLKPYFRKARESVATMFSFGNGAGTSTSTQTTGASATDALDKYRSSLGHDEDDEWDFS